MEYLQTQFSPFFSSSWNPSCHPFQHQHIQMFFPFFVGGWGGILIWFSLNFVYCTRETFGAFYPWFGRGGTAPRLSSLLLLQLKIPLHPIIQWPPLSPQFKSIHGQILIQRRCQEHRPGARSDSEQISSEPRSGVIYLPPSFSWLRFPVDQLVLLPDFLCDMRKAF